MPSNAAFDLFEEICAELNGKAEAFLIDDDFSPKTLRRLARWSGEAATVTALAKAMKYLHKHFKARGAELPFSYDLETGHAVALNRGYIDFVAEAQDRRSIVKESQDFELAT